jgi:TctA family transporter
VEGKIRRAPIACGLGQVTSSHRLPPVSALIMLAGIYYGAQYGGSTTSILVNLPGEASSVVTCIDGYQMAKRGRAGAALSISAIGSFFAGTVGTIVIVLFAGTLTQMAHSSTILARVHGLTTGSFYPIRHRNH